MVIELNGINNNLNPRVRGEGQGSTKESAKARSSNESAAAPSEKVQLSDKGQQLARGENDGSFNAERVEALRQQIESGEYRIDHQKLAGRILGFESNL